MTRSRRSTEQARVAPDAPQLIAIVRHSRKTGIVTLRGAMLTIGIAPAVLCGCAASHREPVPKELKPSVFRGQLGFFTASGSYMPISDAELFVGWGAHGCQPSLQEKEDVDFGSDGTFEIPLYVRVGETRWREFGAPAESPMQADESFQQPCYRFAAPECRDLTVRSLKELESTRLEMRCPGRQKGHPEA